MLQPFLVPSCMPFDIPQPHTTESSAVIKNCESDNVQHCRPAALCGGWAARVSGITQQCWPLRRLWYHDQVMIHQIEEQDIP